MKGGLVLGPFSLVSPCLEGDGEPISLSACLAGSLVGQRCSRSARKLGGINLRGNHIRINQNRRQTHFDCCESVCVCSGFRATEPWRSEGDGG